MPCGITGGDSAADLLSGTIIVIVWASAAASAPFVEQYTNITAYKETYPCCEELKRARLTVRFLKL